MRTEPRSAAPLFSGMQSLCSWVCMRTARRSQPTPSRETAASARHSRGAQDAAGPASLYMVCISDQLPKDVSKRCRDARTPACQLRGTGGRVGKHTATPARPPSCGAITGRGRNHASMKTSANTLQNGGPGVPSQAPSGRPSPAGSRASVTNRRDLPMCHSKAAWHLPNGTLLASSTLSTSPGLSSQRGWESSPVSWVCRAAPCPSASWPHRPRRSKGRGCDFGGEDGECGADRMSVWRSNPTWRTHS